MLLWSLIILSVICTVRGENSCYDCSHAPNEFDYIVALDSIPTALRNCQVTSNHAACHIDIRWDLTLNRTEIDFLPTQIRASSDHFLRVTAAMFGTGVTRQIQHLSYYSCSTDRCNDVNALERLLRSITLRSNLVDLEDLLQPSDTFDGRQCLLSGDPMDANCKSPDTIDPTKCKQCFTRFTHETTTDQLCATCIIEDFQQNYLQREILFNMTDRTRADTWTIQCLLPQCNQFATGRRIREKTSIAFDFDQFPNHTPSLIPSFSLLILAFAIQYVN